MLTRSYLRENRARLNQEDATKLARLFALAKCMHRIITGPDTYKFCAKDAERSAGGGVILFCKSHREQ